jgi:hypothetical protein
MLERLIKALLGRESKATSSVTKKKSVAKKK